MHRTIALLLTLLASTATTAQQTQKFLVTADPAGGGTIQILDALYGQDERLCRAQAQVARDCDGRASCDIRADDNLCGNPYANVAKQLFVGYSCGGDRRSVTVDEGQVAHVYCLASGVAADDAAGSGSVAGTGSPPANWRRGLIYVAQASYGAGNRVCDATSAFSYDCDGQAQCRIEVDNRLCGDPARGTRKGVQVAYWCNGRLEQLDFGESQTAVLNCN